MIVYIASVSLVKRYVLRDQLTAAILGLKKRRLRVWEEVRNEMSKTRNGVGRSETF